MIIYDFGDVVLVPFPFTDHTILKKRPAVVVSSLKYNRKGIDHIIMAITSQLNMLEISEDQCIANWREAGLIKPSIFKPILATVENSLVIKLLGRLQRKDRHTLVGILQDILGETDDIS